MKRFLQTSHSNKILILLFSLTLAALGYIFWQYQIAPYSGKYVAVYLSSGDLYFGKLQYFPLFSLSDVYYIDRDPNNPQAPLRLSKFSNVLWGPTDRIALNRSQVIWISEIKPESQMLQAIRSSNAGIIPTPLQQQPLQLPRTDSGEGLKNSTSSTSSRPAR